MTTTPAAAVVASALPAQADTLEYVTMGDSAAAGPPISDQAPNLPCLRSDRGYPASRRPRSAPTSST